jgi:U4/U6 small nuclear ribonucleoprotein PRP31
MKFIAPNLSALVGTQLASKLMTAAGGIEKLATMPACNIQVMGGQKKSMLGFSRGM